MLKMKEADLPCSVEQYLAEKQEEIDSQETYENRIAKGKLLWKCKSSMQFDIVRETLGTLCVGKRRCNYCEDSVADEVEHIKPKDLYPQLVFAWVNYLFACGNCNGPKGNKYAVFDEVYEVVEITRKRGEKVLPPLEGEDVFINPRKEDPMRFMIMDLQTAWLLPKPGISCVDKQRAEYTIDILRLNGRDFLLAARKEAYYSYMDALRVYVQFKGVGVDNDILHKKKLEIESRHHPTVWAEMKRQRTFYSDLHELFSQAHELLLS